MMNWTNLPPNTSKTFITNTLTGGCKIYIPVRSKIDLDVDEARQKLKAFIIKQRSELNYVKGDYIA